jgi:hypothetical protein
MGDIRLKYRQVESKDGGRPSDLVRLAEIDGDRYSLQQLALDYYWESQDVVKSICEDKEAYFVERCSETAKTSGEWCGFSNTVFNAERRQYLFQTMFNLLMLIKYHNILCPDNSVDLPVFGVPHGKEDGHLNSSADFIE